MSLQEIEAAITQLPAGEQAELTAWLCEHAARVWDEQIARDLQASRLDPLLGEVEKEYRTGLAQPLRSGRPVMTDPTRRTLPTLSAECPEYRLGQMILNIAHLAHEDPNRSLWNVEDEELIQGVRKHLADWRDRHGDCEEAVPPGPESA